MKNILMIINPVSGRLRTRNSLFGILKTLESGGCSVTVRLTQRRGHAAEMAAEAAECGSYDAIVCCGGDGTLNEVLGGLVSRGSDLPVGYIPAGSTNDFAASMGLPLDHIKAAQAIADAVAAGRSLPLDIGSFSGDRYFTYIASFGAFTASSYSAPQAVKNAIGHMAYVLEGIRDFFRIKPIRVSCTDADGRHYECDCVFGGVTNSTSVGGIVKLGKGVVDMNDGLFEVVLIHHPKNAGEFNRIVSAVMSSKLECDMIDFFRTPSLTFVLPEGTPWTLDGECAAGGTEFDIRNIHSAVHLLK